MAPGVNFGVGIRVEGLAFQNLNLTVLYLLIRSAVEWQAQAARERRWGVEDGENGAWFQCRVWGLRGGRCVEHGKDCAFWVWNSWSGVLGFGVRGKGGRVPFEFTVQGSGFGFR